jgi:hypothetical protein
MIARSRKMEGLKAKFRTRAIGCDFGTIYFERDPDFLFSSSIVARSCYNRFFTNEGRLNDCKIVRKYRVKS